MQKAFEPNAFLICANLCIASTLIGCAEGVVVREVRLPTLPLGYMPDKHALAERNASVLAGPSDSAASARTQSLYEPDDLPFQNEWQWNRTSKKHPPKVCLALSGGGVRSAAFSVGVMKGLTELEVLPKVDVISAISGGSYALSWYLAQHFHRKAGPDIDRSLFAETSDEFGHLLAHTRVRTEGDYVAGLGLSLFGIIGNVAANALFGLHANTNPARALYEWRLEEVFMRRPGEPYPTVPDLTPYKLGAWTNTQSGAIPFFVIGATGHIDQDGSRHEGKISNLSFEFTPLQYGSDAYGRYRYPDDDGARKERKTQEPISLARAVSISGAAFDSSQTRGATFRRLATAFNQDLGYFLPNPGQPPEVFAKQSWKFFPFYLRSKGYSLDALGTHIYLTDGGHTENLGVFALVRRLCEEIIVIDAEHDPYYRFEGYYRLQEALQSELHVSLKVNDIERHKPQLGPFKPAEEPNCTKEERAKETCTRDEPYVGDRWRAFAKAPVMSGEICCLPYTGRPNKKLMVTYVKLAAWQLPEYPNADDARRGAKDQYVGGVTQECKFEYPDDQREEADKWEWDLIVGYYHCIIEERAKSPFYVLGHKSDPFPQQPTTDLNFSKTQFRAYVGLGYRIVTGPGASTFRAIASVRDRP